MLISLVIILKRSLPDTVINLTVPKLDKPGGVASFYNAVLPHLNLQFPINIIEIGSNRSGLGFINLFTDQFKLFKSINHSTKLIHINPSLGFKSFIRDGLFILQARLKKIPVIVFFHGWNKNFEHYVRLFLKSFFNVSYAHADSFIVLASEFETILRGWGIMQPIYLETTAIDETLSKTFNIDNKVLDLQSSPEIKILFLSRLEQDKGIYETIDAVAILISKGLPVTLSIAGSGSILENVKNHVTSKQLTENHVKFLGFVQGDEKKQVFESHHVYCFPTNYGEGLPTSVLEAMMFGMPVITRPVGGLVDQFQDGVMGLFCQTMEPMEIAQKIETIISDREMMETMSRFNHDFAMKTYMGSKVAERISAIYQARIDIDNQQHQPVNSQ